MTNSLRLALAMILPTAIVGCQHAAAAPPMGSPHRADAAPSPAAPPPPPPPPDDARSRREEAAHLYRYDFVLTSKDASEPPRSFSVSATEYRHGEIMVGRNVPLQVTSPAPLPSGKEPVPVHGVPRQDVGLRIKMLGQSIPGSEDLRLDVDLELSTAEPGPAGISSIRKFTTRSNVAATPGKSTLIASVDDDKRHLEFAVTPTKIR